ncbi:hypothetical protein SynROS8604_03528 [Synechococcus sp. ROS8604]|nr:hypothetical protein SynROS8604_03528 [Synechococcus sp. ROS8604]
MLRDGLEIGAFVRDQRRFMQAFRVRSQRPLSGSLLRSRTLESA